MTQKKVIKSLSALGPQAPAIKISERLEVAYSSLKNRFKGLNVKLEAANVKLVNKIFELDLLSQYLNNILSNISQGLLFINDQGDVTTYNLAAEQLFKVPRDKVLYQKFWEIFPDDYLGFSMKEALKERKSPGTVFTKIEVDKGDSYDLEIDTNFVINLPSKNVDGTVLSDAAHSLQGLIVLVRNVTEFRRLEVVSQRKNRMNELGEMASMVAHEIRNPLGGIKGFASLLERDLVKQPELQRMAAYIVQGTDSLNELVTRVLNYARPLQMNYKPTDLVLMAQELRNHLLTDKEFCQNIEILVECAEEELNIPLDAQSIHASLLNLARNAIQAMPDGGGKVTISIDKSSPHVIVKVADTGTGIPQENLKKIFSPFFSTRADGNGFGLSEVHKIIQAHDGTIDVDSTLDQGTTFTLKLPLKRQGETKSVKG